MIKLSNDMVGVSCRVKKVTKMTEKVAVGVLSGVLKVSGFFASSAANSKVGKKLFGILPGEMVLASLDGFSMSMLQMCCSLIPLLKKFYANKTAMDAQE